MRKKAAIIDKPWGHEEIWAQSSRYAGKILVINKGHRLSRQYHRVKEETIMVLEGTLVCEEGPTEVGGEIKRHIMGPGEIFHVRPGTIHRFCAEETNVRLVEVSTSETADVVRLEDDYRRITDIPQEIKASGK
ncbi:MAG: cupin domain-containing protein [Betaproteobacteria bacterium]